MSAGPIAQERRGHVPATDKTKKSDLIHAVGGMKGRAYCGRGKVTLTDEWAEVSCDDCAAARRADEAAS